MRRARHAPLRSLFALVLAVPIAFSALLGVPATSADDLSDALARQRALQQRIKDQKAALADLRAAESRVRAALSATNGRLDEINADQAAVRRQIDTATAALEVVQARYEELVAELTHLDWTLGLLEDELAQGQADLAQRRRLLAQRIAAAYKLERTSLLEQILTSDSLTEVLAQVGTYLRLGDQDAELAARIERDREALAELRRTTDGTRFRTDQLRAEVGVQAEAIKEQRAALLAAKKRLDALEVETRKLQERQLAAFNRIAKTKAAAAALLRDQLRAQNALKKEVDRLVREQLERGNIPSEYNGTLEWPLAGRISQEFGCTGFSWEPPLGDCRNFHRGIDIVDDSGAPVRAAGDGVIVFVGYNPWDRPGDRAWIVIIAHSSRLVTWYAHLQPRVPSGVYQGASVQQGQIIGYEGNTGNSTGPHLHWAVQFDDGWMNPRLFL